MKIFSLALRMQVAPPIVKRNRHVLILLRDQNQRYVLGAKKIYPPRITRLVGGGVEAHETFQTAAKRELYEELHYSVPPKSLIPLAKIMARITDAEDQVYQFETAIFFLQLERRPLLPSDDLDGIVRLSNSEFLALIQRYRHLPTELDPNLRFAWFDYGQLYAQVHQIAWECLQAWEKERRQML